MSKNNNFNLIKTGNLKKRKEKKRNMAGGGQVAVVSGLMEAPAFSDRIFCTESSVGREYRDWCHKATPPNSSPTLPSIHTLLTLSLHLTNTPLSPPPGSYTLTSIYPTPLCFFCAS